ncbi:hypothetical protein CQR47_0017 [Bifidobacterium thermophilum]|uniref:Uncharacterized protein n=1 Tax=Bifidobacterium thermophilum TaxID=33905 RepID=A0A2N3QPQ5_9BIFI|nr:hypothetical protein CQR47_0017 [Bifidobacterium thermophilum]
MKVVHWAYQGGIFDHCVCGAESGAGIARGFFRPSGGRAELLREPDTPALNRESHAEIGTSPSRSRTAPRPPPMATSQNLGIPTFRPHHNNQPLLAPQPESTKSWTKSENKTPKPIQSTIAPTFTAPPTTATSQNRGISAIHPRRSSNRKPATRQQARIHGPNRRTRDEIGTGPQQRQTALGLQSRCLPRKPTPE